jgi:alpha-beta hydrolase superfamily lysophospholipase
VGEGLDFSAIATGRRPLPVAGSYPTRNGSLLPVRVYGSSGVEAWILLHGSGHHSAYLAPLAEGLADGGAAVYTPDLRGHGADPERRGDVDSIDQLEDDLADLVAWVRERHPGGALRIAGHSSGGGLALRFAGGAYGRRADGYALLAPFLAHDAPTMRGGSAGGWARARVGRIVLLSILNGFGVHAFDDSVVITFRMPEAVRDGTETLAYTHRLNVGYAPRSWAADLAAAPAPLLVLVGSLDEAFAADRFEAAIRGHAPEAKVHLVEGATHLGLVGDPRTAEHLIAWTR